MRMRDGWFLMAGAATGAGLLSLAGGRDVPDRTRVATPIAPPGSPEGPEAGVAGLRELAIALQGLVPGGTGPGEPPAIADPGESDRAREGAAAAVAPLLDRWRVAAPGEERAAAMKALALPLFRLLDAGGSTEHLSVLEESAERGESGSERRWAVIATHRLRRPEAVDFLLARARSPHAEVRFYAVEGLAWVRGEEARRAVEGVVQGMEDPDPGVRGIAALSLGAIVADPDRAGAILDRLARETDDGAAKAMALAVETLDPKEGKARVAAVRPGAR